MSLASPTGSATSSPFAASGVPPEVIASEDCRLKIEAWPELLPPPIQSEICNLPFAAVNCRYAEDQPGRQVLSISGLLVAEDCRRAERQLCQAGEAPGRVRVASPRARGRAVPGGQRQVAHEAACCRW